MPAYTRLSANQWTYWWNQSNLTSFKGAANINYDKNFERFWDRQWRKLMDNAFIVDLATGNGAIAILAAKYSGVHGKKFSITGIDSANINPGHNLQNLPESAELARQIEFRGNTQIENTGLGASSADMLSSQYGFEYADIEKAIIECERILKPGGLLALILHNENSYVVKQAKESINLYDQVCGSHKLDQKILMLLAELEKGNNESDNKCEELRNAINSSIGELNKLEQSFSDLFVLDYAIPNLMSPFGKYKHLAFDKKCSLIAKVRLELDQYALRMQDLVSASLSPEKFAWLEGALSANNFSIENSGLFYYEDKQLMGWQIEANKNQL